MRENIGQVLSESSGEYPSFIWDVEGIYLRNRGKLKVDQHLEEMRPNFESPQSLTIVR